MEDMSQEERVELQQALLELERSRQASEAIQEQINILAGTISEIEMTTETIKGYGKLNEEAEILVPIGSDSYIPAKAADTDRVLTGLGARIVVEDDQEKAEKFLEGRKEEYKKSIEKARERLEEISDRIEELAPKVEELMEKARSSRGGSRG